MTATETAVRPVPSLTPAETAHLAPLVIPANSADVMFREARTTNAFSDVAVSDEEIHAAYDLMRWGPTAMNISPLRYLIVRSPEARERLAAHMSEGNRAKTLAAPLTVVIAADGDFHAHLPVLAPFRAETAAQLAEAPDTRAQMARTNTLIQTGYFIPALRAAGLHVGPMGGFDADAIDSEFFTESNWRTVLVLNVGHPAAEGAHHPRAARLMPVDVSRAV